MLWTDERIEGLLMQYVVEAEKPYAKQALEVMRDEYERAIVTSVDDVRRTELWYETRLNEKDARIAELETLDTERLAQIIGKNEVIDKMRDEHEARIAEKEQTFADIMTEVARVSEIRLSRIADLESKLATSTELEEAHLLEIDRLNEALNDSRRRELARF